MNIRKSIRKKLQEAVGVIPNVDLTANKIYRAMINSLENDDWSLEDWKKNKQKEYEYSGDFQVGKFEVDGVNLKIAIKPSKNVDTIALQEMSLGAMASFDYDTKDFEQSLSNNEIFIIIVLNVNYENEKISNLDDDFNQYLVDYIEKNDSKFLSSISHEVAHSYGILIKHPQTALGRAYYEGANSVSFGSVEPINDLIFAIYFSHEVENLVRPNELNTLFNKKNITPKQFYDALTSSRVYNKYKQMRDLNYNLFKDLLETQYVKQINKVLQHINAPDEILNSSPEEKVNTLLNLLSYNLRENTKNSLLEMAVSPKEKFFANILGDAGLSRDTRDFMIENLKKIFKRYPEDGELFAQKLIKELNIIGDKMIKKISKLYSLVNNEEPELTNLEKYKRHKQ